MLFKKFSIGIVLWTSTIVVAKPGDLIRVTEMASFTPGEIAQELGVFCPGTVSKIENSTVRSLSLTYETTGFDGNPAVASAAVLIPLNGAHHLSVVSYQHATMVERGQAPTLSRPGIWSEGRFAGACYGSQGYAVVEADYLGFGASIGVHPYLHAQTEASASADALRAAGTAAKNLGYALDGKLFLAGYSQGGHSTMALHRYLQEHLKGEFTVTASTPMAGPYQLSETFREVMNAPDKASSLEAAYLLVSYNKVYSLFASLNDAIDPKYASLLEGIFPGTLSLNAVASLLPTKPLDLLQSAFSKAVMSNESSRFSQALLENDVYNWKPDSPVMLIQGEEDTQVPTFNSTVAEKTMRDLGANVKLVFIPGKNHESAVPFAFAKSIAWFNSF